MNYYNQIKEKLMDNEVYKKVKDFSKNRNDLNTYYEVGKLLIEAQGGEARAKYGDGLIKEYSEKLTKEVGKGYSTRNLKNMRKFYLFVQKGQAVPAQLSWSHYGELLRLDNANEINYYTYVSIEQNLSYRQLHDKIKSKEYERLNNKTKEKLIIKEENKVSDFIKNPILIKNSYNCEKITEKMLKQLILEDIDSFLKELGSGFSYIENEYKIKRVKRFDMDKPITVEDAIMQMNLLEHNFFVFRNSESEDINIVYKRHDGYGLIEQI